MVLEKNSEGAACSTILERLKSRTMLFSVLSILFLMIVSVLFFYPDDIQGNTLQQYDMVQGMANSHELETFKEQTGENTRWTNSLFSGMPTFQIAPSYKASPVLNFVERAYSLWLPQPANLLFIMMLGFFIMCLCMGFKWHVSLFGALAWGFSTYFIIIIGAGHIWKFVTLAYIPPTIGGIALCYRKKYLGGVALAALFGALQLKNNHPQMTYYFLFVILALMIGWLIMAVRRKDVKSWVIATACVLGAGTLGVMANAAHLYASYEYSKETIRGRATDLKSNSGQEASGLDKEYITGWSYSGDETFTLLIPNVKGGATLKPVGGQNMPKSVGEIDGFGANLSAEEEAFAAQNFNQYFGDQPLTNGPVYVGAFVLLLAIMAFFCGKGAMRWCMLAVMVLAILLSWGHNFMPLTDFFIDHVPFYNKFRTVSSILVIVEFVVPLLAVYTIHNMITTRDWWKHYSKQFYVVFGVGAFICLMGCMWPGMFGGGFSNNETEMLKEAGAFSNPMYSPILEAVRNARMSLVRSDCWRSLIFIVLGGGVVWLYFNTKVLKPTMMVLSLSAIALIDLYSVNKRYVDTENFTEPMTRDEIFVQTAADKQILKDKSNYRVLDLNEFGSPQSSYYHKTIGGYHAAKLTRYEDLINNQIKKNNMEVLNMLNTKYIIVDPEHAEANPDANGNAWFVDRIDYVADANAEMKGLDSLDTKRAAVADKKFMPLLGKATGKAAGDTIYETSYAADKLTYKARTAKENIAVFSEIYFPWGWEATIDGKPAEIGRVNYVLRAMRIPAGEHEISMQFRPSKVETAESWSLVTVIIILMLTAAAILYALIGCRCCCKNKNSLKESTSEDSSAEKDDITL